MLNMAGARKQKVTFGKPFKKKTTSGKFKKGTWIKYKYNSKGRRIGAVKSRR